MVVMVVGAGEEEEDKNNIPSDRMLSKRITRIKRSRDIKYRVRTFRVREGVSSTGGCVEYGRVFRVRIYLIGRQSQRTFHVRAT